MVDWSGKKWIRVWGCKLLKNVPPSGAWSAPGSPPSAEVVSKGGKERLLFIFVLWHSHFSWDKRLSQSRKVHFVLLACTLFIFFKYLLSFRREAIYFPLFCRIIRGQSYLDSLFCHMAAMAWDPNQSMSWLFFSLFPWLFQFCMQDYMHE